jgi:DNA-binding beta-propeller fold protein YncE
VRVYDFAGKHLHDLGVTEDKDRATKGKEDGQFYFPAYLAVDKDGQVYVADTMNFRIQVFDPEGRFVRKYGQNGDGPGSFSRIKGITFDGFDNLYVVDGGHSNVQLFNRNFDLLMWFGGFAPKLLEYFDVPSCIAIDPRVNRIYVCNQGRARINVYDLINTKADDNIAPPAPGPGPSESDSE